jgi:acyl transferase domain-containing protein
MSQPTTSGPVDIAIVGLAGCYAGARNATAYWQNILDKVDSVTEAGPEWTGPYLDVDNALKTNDRIYTTKGGFLRDLAEVNPIEFGVLPSMAEGGDPDHMMALKHARDALRDAGYSDGRGFAPERAGVIIGRGTYGNRGLASVLARGLFLDQAMTMARQLRPDLSDAEIKELREHFRQQLPLYNADMVGVLTPNVIAGLIANRLNLMGPNFIVDAACASSLIALDAAVRELASGRCDLMITGGVHSHTPPQLYIQFCQIQALSHDKIRPFQKGSNGILLGEGVGMMVLKRLADAEAQGDRIYAVIKGVGLSSDGKAKGLLAPRYEGQVLAVQRAYESSGIDPLTVDLIQAHGTGTDIGDRTEIQTLDAVFSGRGPGAQIAVGSVKSQIAHCLPASGSASLIKAALALHHRVLPPMICEEPDPELHLERTPFYINNEVRPWVHGKPHPRRAGVNAFGFGGANAHVIMEEYVPRAKPAQLSVLHRPDPSELVVLAANSPAELNQLAASTLKHLRGSCPPSLAEIAQASAQQAARGSHRLGIVAENLLDLEKKLDQALDKLHREPARPFKTRSGLYYGIGAAPGKVCFLYPGEGAQYPNMLADLCVNFPQLREWFDFLEETALRHGVPGRAAALFPAPTGLDEDQRRELEARLYDMDVAAESVYFGALGLQELLDDLGFRPDAMLGHSSGENTAITACRVRRFTEREQIAESVRDLNRIFRRLEAEGRIAQGTLLTVGALKPEARAQLLQRLEQNAGGMWLAMDNCPNQVVLFGPPEAAQTLKEQLVAEGAICAELPFGRAYHTALFKPLADAYREYFKPLEFSTGRTVLYSARAVGPFPQQEPLDADAIRELAASQWEHPVRFTDTLQRLYQDGYRVFVEVGPSGNLTSFVTDTLRDKHDVVAAACNSRRRSGVLQLHQLLAQLFAAGVGFEPAALYRHRQIAELNLRAEPRPAPKKGMTLKLLMPELRLPENWKPLQRPFQAAAPAPAKTSEPARAEPAPVPKALAPAVPAAPTDPRLQVLQTHFSLMQEFLDGQARVLGSLTAPPVMAQPAPAPGEHDPAYPLLGRIVERSAQRLVVERIYEADTDLFLQDHAIGPPPSAQQPQLRALIVMPFTLSMEILAEAAHCLAGEPYKVIGIENSRGSRWLGCDDGPLRLRIVAERQDGSAEGPRVMVRLFQESSEQQRGRGTMVFEGLVQLAAQYPQAPAARPWSGSRDHAPRSNPDGELYSHGMFHGPRLQGVRRIRRWADEAIEADMAVIATHDYFSFTAQPRFRMDGALLDAVGQLAAYWLTEKWSWEHSCFPFQVGQYTQYADPPAPGTQLVCRGAMELVDDAWVKAQFDVFDTQGRIIMRVANWGSRKFTAAPSLYHFRFDPLRRYLTQPVAQGEIVVRRLEAFPEGYLDQGGGLWQRMVANLVLDAEERQVYYRELPAAGPRREEWLVGRIAAKDAVREWLLRQHGLLVPAADIRIAEDAQGRAQVTRIAGLPAGLVPPALNIQVHQRSALAACAAPGVDLAALGTSA